MKFAIARTKAGAADAEHLLQAMLHHFAAFMLRNAVRGVEPPPFDTIF
jgi:hypothetical protein